MKGVRMQKAQAMGKPAPLGKGGGNTFKAGNAGQGSLPSTTKTVPSTVPRKLATKPPKGA